MVYKSNGWIWITLTFFVLVIGFAFPVYSDFYIVANKDFPPVSQKEIKELFLGFKSSLSTGQIPTLIISKEVGKEFAEKFLGIQYNDFKAHWMSKAFAGVTILPKQIGSVEAIDILKRDPNAIGVVPKTGKIDGVKVLLEVK
ncbi:MAG: hypothetical protein QXY59_05615 [Candidatus Korarchaeota archaeon]